MSSDNLNIALNQAFAGKIVRKDLTKKIKEGVNVLEYLLGMYCTSDDEASIEVRVNTRQKTHPMQLCFTLRF